MKFPARLVITIMFSVTGIGAAAAEDFGLGSPEAAYRTASEGGDSRAMYALGVIFDEGVGVSVDESQAYQWYARAAARGECQAMNRLGLLYAEGRGVPQDFVAALAWYRLAAAKGSLTAVSNVATAYFYGLGVPRNFAEAAKLLKTAASRGDAAAQNRLGAMYNDGLGLARDHGVARNLFRRATDQLYPPAMVNLGRMYIEALGGNRDEIQGYALLQAGVSLGVPDSMRQIAAYELGIAAARLHPAQLAQAQRLAARLTGDAGAAAGTSSNVVQREPLPWPDLAPAQRAVPGAPRGPVGQIASPDRDEHSAARRAPLSTTVTDRLRRPLTPIRLPESPG